MSCGGSSALIDTKDKRTQAGRGGSRRVIYEHSSFKPSSVKLCRFVGGEGAINANCDSYGAILFDALRLETIQSYGRETL